MQSLAFGGSLVFSLLAARWLGPEGTGLVAVLMFGGQLAALVLSVGLQSSIPFFVAAEPLRARAAARHLHLQITLIAITLVAAVLANHALRIGPFGFPFEWPFVLFVLSAVALSGYAAISLSLGNYGVVNQSALLDAALALLLLALAKSGQAVTAANVLLAQAMGQLAGFAFVAVKLRPRLTLPTTVQLKWLDQLSISRLGFASAVLAVLMLRGDLFLVTVLGGGLAAAGVYSIGTQLAEMILRVPNWVAALLAPAVASDRRRAAGETIHLFRLNLGFALGLALATWALRAPAETLVGKLFGEPFAPASVVMLLLLPRVVLQSGGTILAGNLVGRGYTLYHPASVLVATVTALGLDLLLLPTFGIVGAAVASSTGYALSFVVILAGFLKHNHIRVGQFVAGFWAGRDEAHTASARGALDLRTSSDAVMHSMEARASRPPGPMSTTDVHVDIDDLRLAAEIAARLGVVARRRRGLSTLVTIAYGRNLAPDELGVQIPRESSPDWAAPRKPLVSLGPGRWQASFDLVEATRALLYLAADLGSSPGVGSVPSLLKSRPVVDCWWIDVRDALRSAAALRGVSTSEVHPWPAGKTYVTLLSHDVDLLEGRSLGWLRRAHWRYQLTRAELRNDAARARFWRNRLSRWNSALTTDPHYTLPAISSDESRLGLRSTFYWFSRDWPLSPDLGRSYALRSPGVRRIIQELEARGFENAVHGSSRDVGSQRNFARERHRLERVTGKPVAGIRQHGLRLDIERTWESQRRAGFSYDASLGWNTAVGFRAGTSLPIAPCGESDSPFLVLPLIVQDGPLSRLPELEGSAYMWLEHAVRLRDECRSAGGIFSVLFHPVHWDDVDFPGMRDFYQALLQEQARDTKSWTVTAREAALAWSAHLNIVLDALVI